MCWSIFWILSWSETSLGPELKLNSGLKDENSWHPDTFSFRKPCRVVYFLGAIAEFRCYSIDGGGLEAAWGNREPNLSLWWFLKITERIHMYGRAFLSGSKYIIFTYIPSLIVFSYKLVKKILISWLEGSTALIKLALPFKSYISDLIFQILY